MARLPDTANFREVFDAVADGVARMSNVGFNICTPNGKPSEKLTGHDIERVRETAAKAHKLAVLLSKLYDNSLTDSKAIIEFNHINP